MPRILVVDDDPLARAVLADLVRKAGQEPVPATSGAQALDLLTHGSYALVISDVRMPDIDGFELVRRMADRGLRVPVALSSAVRDAEVLAEAARRGARFVGFLAKPPAEEPLGRLLERWCAEPLPYALHPEDSWADEEFLRRIAGPASRFPVARTLFLAHRAGTTGLLVYAHGRTRIEVGFRGGRIVHASGLPDLLPGAGQADLSAAVSGAIARGEQPDAALEAVAATLGRWAVEAEAHRSLTASWDAAYRPAAGAFQLPTPVPRMLATGHRVAAQEGVIHRRWWSRSWAKAHASLPDDALVQRWELDPLALRLLKLAGEPLPITELLQRAGGLSTVRPEVLRSLDFLYVLGLLVVEDLGETDAQTNPVLGADTAALTMLREAHRAMDSQRPAEVLGLRGDQPLTPNGVATAYRALSLRLHPDQFQSHPREVRVLAEACFAQVTTAYAALQDPALLEEENRRVEAQRKGLPYVTDSDRRAAKTAWRRGDMYFRGKEWKPALVQFQEALRLDPLTWPHALATVQAGWRAGTMSSADALRALGEIGHQRPEQHAELLVEMARIHTKEGRADEAARLAGEALEKHPENRDAQRELRLWELRNPPKPTTPGGSIFTGLLSRLPGR